MLASVLLLQLTAAAAVVGQYPQGGGEAGGDPAPRRGQVSQGRLYSSTDPDNTFTIHTVHRNRDFSTGTERPLGDPDGGGYSNRYTSSRAEDSVTSSDNSDGDQGTHRAGANAARAQTTSGVDGSSRLVGTSTSRRDTGGSGSRSGGVRGESFGGVRSTPDGGDGDYGAEGYRRRYDDLENQELLSRQRPGDRQRLDGITLLLQRVGDRLLAMEAAQVQRAERIDTVHYRMTRLEVSAEEQKAAVGELAAAVRHRLQTSDFELEKIRDGLDEIRAATVSIGAQNTKTQAYLEAQQAAEAATAASQASGGQTPRLKSVLTAVHGVRGLSQEMARHLEGIQSNMTALVNISSSLSQLTELTVSKPFLRSSLAELRSQRHPLLLPQASCTGTAGPAPPAEPSDCYEVQQRDAKAPSGVYLIQPRYSAAPFFAYCDMDTDGGGWTVLQRRQDGSVDFLREWLDYKYGFGNLAGEFWLGNEYIHRLTNQHVCELRIEVADFSQEVALAQYSAFAIGGEEEGYALKLLGHFTGDAGDSLSYHVGQRWSTIDSDSDAWPEQNCARDHHGAWWYRACDTSNLNGQYLHGQVPSDHEYKGIYWYDFRGPDYSLWRTSIMVRRGGSVHAPVSGVTLPPPTTPPTTTEVYNEEDEETEDPYRGRDGRGRRGGQRRDFDPDRDPLLVYDGQGTAPPPRRRSGRPA